MFRPLYNWLSNSRNAPNTRVAVLPGRSTLWTKRGAVRQMGARIRLLAEMLLDKWEQVSNTKNAKLFLDMHHAEFHFHFYSNGIIKMY